MERIKFYKKLRKRYGWLRRNFAKIRVKEKEDYIKWSTNRTNSKERIQTNICNKATIRGSLDNVSKIPDNNNQSISTLRRTRSLAISRENLFYSLNYTEESTKENRRRRAQLIPRAKLIERSFSRDSRYESLQVENTRYSQKQIQNKPEEIPPDYSPLPKNNFTDKFPQKKKDQIYDLPPIYNTRNNTLESNFTEFKKTHHHTKKSLENLTGLSLPHYYPDSEVTDNISITDNLSIVSFDKFKSYTSLDNFTNNNWGPESIPYDENIILAKKPENNKLRTIRAPHPKFDYKNLPQFNKNNKIQHVVDEISSPSSLEFETNTNWDEIKLNNEHITKVKVDTNDTTSIIIVQQQEEKLIESSKSNNKKLLSSCSNTERKTVKEDQNFKTVVTVNDSLQHEEDTKSHSHNYLKEFLETQKGSKKPLQSFIAKKFLNLTRKQQSNTKSNLVTNQFYSLPDINVSKNLHKCEKIDQKLRKCVVKAPAPKDRFIVNIGSHLDITGNNIPLDFELKIAKVPKKNKKQHAKEFEEAVKSVNNTLQTNGFSVDLNNNNNNNSLTEIKENIMDPEIQEKLGSMRNYWTKITGHEEVKEITTLQEKEPCKIIDIKKKFEPQPVEMEKSPNKIQLAKQVFEPKIQQEKVSPIIKETCNYFEKSSTTNNSSRQTNNCYESLCPTAIDLVTHQAESEKSNNNKNNLNNIPEFDHVRYKVIKPELFNKKILANCKNQEEFDVLMQYLKDYSFQELLIDNNIVIIEPIRSKVPHNTSRNTKPSAIKNKNGIKSSSSSSSSEKDELDDVKQSLRKHFFYHPIRVNKEVNDDELPNPNVVRQARQFFEKSLKNDRIIKEKIGTDNNHHADDKDKCTRTSAHSTLSLSEDTTDRDDDDQIYDSLDNNNECCQNTEYVSEDILEKIREYGTTITYYGGRVVNQNYGQPAVLTKLIMEEIKNNEKRCMIDCNGCRRKSVDKTLSEVNNEYQGIKFKLVKSNSCNSRLELVGAAARKKNINNNNNNNKNTNNRVNNNISIKESNDDDDDDSTVAENNIRLINNNSNNHNNNQNQPKIIGEEKKINGTDNPNNKYVQWSEIKNSRSNNNNNNSVQFNDNKNDNIKNYDYREKIKNRLPINDMEFEPYEVA